MAKIHLLDKSVYELIAAGEVIDRPMAVIKEMVENSIDAGSTKITVEIKNGGKTYMRITDNGCGIAPEDVPLAFVRHATSKITTADDLEKIFTLGFRGEALASICAVSKVDVMTKRKEDNLGYHYAIEGDKETVSEAIGCPDGTTFVVRDLFFSLPARWKYLKKDVTEGNAIASMLQKLALSHPEISLKFIRDNKMEFVTAGDGKLLSCIYTILGKEMYDSSIPVEYVSEGVKVTGYVTKPIASRSSRNGQIFFINKRYVKSLTCIYALEEAYKDRIMTGKFPACVLNIDVNPDFVDVNAHPSKIEVRFQNEGKIYDILYFAVKNALLAYDTPVEAKLDNIPEKTLTFNEVYSEPIAEEKAEQFSFGSNKERTKKDFKTVFVPTERSAKAAMASYIAPHESLKSKPENEPKPDTKPKRTFEINGFKYINSSAIAKREAEKIAAAPKPEEITVPPVRVIGEAFKTYIVAECGDDVLLIDKHAAHERMIYEDIKSKQTDLDMQMLLVPVNTTVSYEIFEALSENPAVCQRLGFGVKLLSPPVISIYGMPTIADNMDPIDLLTRIATCLLCGKKNEGSEVFDDIYHSIACKAAIKANSDTDKLELEKIVELITADDLRYCPHGRPILIKLTKREIEKNFKRIV